MSKKTLWFVFLFFAFVVSSSSPVFSADSSSIDKVLKSAISSGGAIGPSDSRVIESYISRSLEDMIDAVDFSEIASIRREVGLRSIEKKPSRYSLAFSSAIENSIDPFMASVERIDSQQRKTQLVINLMILVAEAESMELADFSISMLDHENVAVRYWAVKALGSEGIANQLKVDVTGDKDLARRIIAAFESKVNPKTTVELLDLMVKFADQMQTAEAVSLINRIADVRIKAYADWTVKYESMEANLLDALANNIKAMTSGDGKKPGPCGKRFAQLYSYMIQRYILGYERFDIDHRKKLATIIGDVEVKSLSKLIGNHNSIKQVISGNSERFLEKLSSEHDKLLGSEKNAGKLCYEMRFDYGTTAGKPVTAPKKLVAPVVEVTD